MIKFDFMDGKTFPLDKRLRRSDARMSIIFDRERHIANHVDLIREFRPKESMASAFEETGKACGLVWRTVAKYYYKVREEK